MNTEDLSPSVLARLKSLEERSELYKLWEENTLLEHMETYSQEHTSGVFHMPGHKRKVKHLPYLQLLRADLDLSEIESMDDLHQPKEVLQRPHRLAELLYQSKKSFLLVNGSTAGILAGIRAFCKQGDTILMARNCHRSVYHGAELQGLNVFYVEADFLSDFSCSSAISLNSLKKKWAEVEALGHLPKAFILTSPNYEGIVSDLEAIAAFVHQKGAFLLVDEAHGAHLDLHRLPCLRSSEMEKAHKFVEDFETTFSKTLPKECSNDSSTLLARYQAIEKISWLSFTHNKTNEGENKTPQEISKEASYSLGHKDFEQSVHCFRASSALASQADYVVQSLHKTLPSFTGTALCHLQTDRVSEEALRHQLKIFQTSSPNYILMASIDACLHYLATEKAEQDFLAWFLKCLVLRKRLGKLKYLKCLGSALQDFSQFPAYDFSKFVLSTIGTSWEGSDLGARLRSHGTEMEMISKKYCLFMTSPLHQAEDFAKLEALLLQLDAQCGKEMQELSEDERVKVDFHLRHLPALPEQRLCVHKAYNLEKKLLPFAACEDKMAGEYVWVYPPGIPLLVPGEVISASLIEEIRSLLALGLTLQPPCLYDGKFSVLAEDACKNKDSNEVSS